MGTAQDIAGKIGDSARERGSSTVESLRNAGRSTVESVRNTGLSTIGSVRNVGQRYNPYALGQKFRQSPFARGTYSRIAPFLPGGLYLQPEQMGIYNKENQERFDRGQKVNRIGTAAVALGALAMTNPALAAKLAGLIASGALGGLGGKLGGGGGGGGGGSGGAMPSTGVRPLAMEPLSGDPRERVKQYLEGQNAYPGRPDRATPKPPVYDPKDPRYTPPTSRDLFYRYRDPSATPTPAAPALTLDQTIRDLIERMQFARTLPGGPTGGGGYPQPTHPSLVTNPGVAPGSTVKPSPPVSPGKQVPTAPPPSGPAPVSPGKRTADIVTRSVRGGYAPLSGKLAYFGK